MAEAVYSRNSTLKAGNRQHKKIKFLGIITLHHHLVYHLNDIHSTNIMTNSAKNFYTFPLSLLSRDANMKNIIAHIIITLNKNHKKERSFSVTQVYVNEANVPVEKKNRMIS